MRHGHGLWHLTHSSLVEETDIQTFPYSYNMIHDMSLGHEFEQALGVGVG